MESIRLLLIEDQPADANRLRQQLEALGYCITAVAHNLEAALGAYYSDPPDVVISDILLGTEKDGIAFAERINETPGKARPLIFLTGLMDMTTFQSARAVRPFSYLLKPYNELELQYAIELAIEQFAAREGVFTGAQPGAVLLFDYFFVRRGHYLIKLPVADILYIVVEGRYCNVHSSESRFLVQLSLKELLAQLPDADFLRIHRNYVVRASAIHRVDVVESMVELTDGTALPLSRECKKLLLARLQIL